MRNATIHRSLEERISTAKLPTWIKARLQHAALSESETEFASLGWQIAHREFCDFEGAGDSIVDVTDREISARPTAILRRLFKTVEHPGAEFVDLIPSA